MLVGMATEACRYTSKKLDDDEVGMRLRFGYPRLHILLTRQGMRLNHKRLFRIYREERLGCASVAVASES